MRELWNRVMMAVTRLRAREKTPENHPVRRKDFSEAEEVVWRNYERVRLQR